VDTALPVSNGWLSHEYRWYRFVFGAYLAVHFAALLPWGTELFSSRGVLPEAGASPLAFVFPNLLAFWDAPGLVAAVLGIAVVMSVALAAGWADRMAAILLWYVWACLYGRNPLIGNPGLPYVGWLLLGHACLPRLRGGLWCPDDTRWRMPGEIHGAAWTLMALGYTYSGLTKLTSPSWMDGTAFARILENPLARPGPTRDLLLALPSGLQAAATWGALGLEIAFAPLALSPWMRPWLWTGMVGMHLALIALIDFADLSLGMVILHLFTFDPAWVRGPPPLRRAVLASR